MKLKKEIVAIAKDRDGTWCWFTLKPYLSRGKGFQWLRSQEDGDISEYGEIKSLDLSEYDNEDWTKTLYIRQEDGSFKRPPQPRPHSELRKIWADDDSLRCQLDNEGVWIALKLEPEWEEGEVYRLINSSGKVVGWE